MSKDFILDFKTTFSIYPPAIIVLLALSINAFSQQQILVDRLSVDNGLSQSDVRCIVQDKFGFLWIGTRDGLNRFDGSSFEQFHFDNEDTAALAFTQIHSLLALSNGDLIVGSLGGISIFRHRDATFENIFLPDKMRNAVVTDLSADSTMVRMGTTQGLLSLDISTRTFVSDPSYQQFHDMNVTQVKMSETHDEWIGTTSGLYRKLRHENAFTRLLKDTIIHNIMVGPGEIFISTNRGLHHYTSSDQKFMPVKLLPGFTNVLSARRFSNGEIWVASNQVLILSPDGATIEYTLSHQDNDYRSLSEDRARILYETRDGIMWIGTFGYGLNKHDPRVRRIEYFGTTGKVRLSSPYVSAIYSPNDTLVFVGTSRGVNIIDREKQTNRVFNPYAGSIPERLFLTYAIREDRSGALWMSGSGGLYAWRENQFISQNVNLSEIVDFVEFDSSSLLLVTRLSGCYLFEKETKHLSPFIEAKKFPSDLLTARIADSLIWIGATDGLRKFNLDGTLQKHYTANPNDSSALPSNVIKSLNDGRNGVLWIGTWGGGLSRYDNQSESFKTFTMNDGLPSNVVYGAIEDDSGFLWLATNNGVAAFDPGKISFNNFDVRDGLQSNEFNTGAYFKTRYGRIYFGGINGLNAFDPEEMLALRETANVRLTGATVENGSGGRYNSMLDTPNTIDLRWHQNTVTLHLAIIDFRFAHKYTLQYTINDGPWKNLGSARRIDLTELAPGQYQVKTRASINGFAWSDALHLITIKVSTPFWRHPLTLVAAALTIMAMGYLVQRAHVRRLTKRNELLDRLVLSRTREVQQKNEEIVAQNEELQSQTDELSQKNSLLEQNKTELESFQKELERRVDDRTHDIQNLNVKLIKQNVQLEQFSFITAHNFKGPIARIKGLINLLSEAKVTTEDFNRIRDFLRVSIEDLDNVTHDLNTILHIRGTSKEEFRRIDLRVVLEEVLSSLDNEIKTSGIAIDIGGFGDCMVVGVPAFVHSVFHNLLENAIKYRTHESVPIVTIKCFHSDGVTIVEVADNGIGIDMVLAQQKIFHIYQRFNYAPGGRGLGLYMVKTQMEMMGGDVSVQSQLNKGTKFSLTFLNAHA
jgi:signal transduction histidine kinase/ligand-binding sensor domain-containing protein